MFPERRSELIITLPEYQDRWGNTVAILTQHIPIMTLARGIIDFKMAMDMHALLLICAFV